MYTWRGTWTNSKGCRNLRFPLFSNQLPVLWTQIQENLEDRFQNRSSSNKLQEHSNWNLNVIQSFHKTKNFILWLFGRLLDPMPQQFQLSQLPWIPGHSGGEKPRTERFGTVPGSQLSQLSLKIWRHKRRSHKPQMASKISLPRPVWYLTLPDIPVFR